MAELFAGGHLRFINGAWRDDNGDPVEIAKVVRCKDCKWYSMAPYDNVPYCSHESGYCGEYMGGLFYCACGERKDNG